MASPTDIEQLKKRTKSFSVRVFKLCRALPSNREADTIARQLLRSASSVAANHRAVCRSRSRADFIAKLGIVIEEADETLFWLEYLVDCEVMPGSKMAELMKEANELTAIFVSARETSRARKW